MSSDFIVRFWGVRGGHAVPGPSTVLFGGNTACVEVQVGGHTIILDGGTGLIPLGNELLRRGEGQSNPMHLLLLLSHTHSDHTQGIPYFRPAYVGSTRVYIFGPHFNNVALTQSLEELMQPAYFPLAMRDLAGQMLVEEVRDGSQIYLWPGNPEPRHVQRCREPAPEGSDDAICVDVQKSYAHPQHGVLFYRVSYKGKSVVYATDTEGYVGGDQRLVDLARGVDLLIHDAQYTVEEYTDPHQPRQGWGHSTPEMAAEVAEKAGVKRLALFHLDPLHDDSTVERIEATTRELFEDCFVAREGLAIEL